MIILNNESNIVSVYSDDWNIKEIHRNGNELEVKNIEFDNYFYAKVEDIDKIEAFASTFEENIELNIIKNKLYKTITNKFVYKIYLKFYFSKFTKFIKSQGIELFESDLGPYVKYIVDNKIKYSKNRRIFYIDIETEMCNTPFFPDKPITCIGIFDTFINKYINFTTHETLKKLEIRDNIEVRISKDEVSFIKDFIEYFINNRPDILAGWYSNNFDIPYIIKRAEYLNIDISKVSLSDESPKYKCIKYQNTDGSDRVILKLGGVECLDMLPILDRITKYMEQSPDWSLNTVCQFHLGEEYCKKEIDLNKYKEQFKEFIEYNIRDIELLKLLDEKMGILNYAITLQTEVVPVTLNSITYNTHLVEMFLKLKYPEIILTDKPSIFDLGGNKINIGEGMRVKVKGANTGRMIKENGITKFIDPIAGIYKNVEVVDFAGMYPTIYSSFSLSPENLDANGDLIIDDIEAEIKQGDSILKEIKYKTIINTTKRGLLPEFVDSLREERKKYKIQLKSINKETNFLEYQRVKALEDVMKLCSNAAFGVFSFNNFRLYNPYINGAITKIAREAITFINENLITLGYTPLYSDTDSCFIYKDGQEIKIDDLLLKLNENLKEYMENKYPQIKGKFIMLLDHAYSFKTIVMKEAKKRYFGILKNDKFLTKGFDIIKKDYPKKFKPILKQLFIDLLDKDKNCIKNKLKEIKIYLKTLEPKEFGINLNIARDLSTYKNNSQHIRAAIYSNDNLGTTFNVGSKCKLVFVISTGSYPHTDVIAVNDDLKVPIDFIIDYDKTFNFLIIKKLELLSDIKDFDINYIISPNKSLFEFQ